MSSEEDEVSPEKSNMIINVNIHYIHTYTRQGFIWDSKLAGGGGMVHTNGATIRDATA